MPVGQGRASRGNYYPLTTAPAFSGAITPAVPVTDILAEPGGFRLTQGRQVPTLKGGNQWEGEVVANEPMELPEEEQETTARSNRRINRKRASRKQGNHDNSVMGIFADTFGLQSAADVYTVFAWCVVAVGAVIVFFAVQTEPMPIHNAQAMENYVKNENAKVNRLIFGVFVVAAAASSLLWYIPGFRLKETILAIGEIRGLSKSAIFRILGSPNSIVHMDDNKFAAGWSAGSYSIVLLFQDSKCLGVHSENNIQ